MCICHTANLLCFNSRTLGRVRQIYLPTLDEERGVSIHAPWEGCDRYTTIFIVARIMFQFTHPGKGATNRTLPKEEVLRVSIHAPWEGCDRLLLTRTRIRQSFNSRTLGRVRPITPPAPWASRAVSIHAPWEGCDIIVQRAFIASLLFQFTHPGKGAT